jgi:hypothetical protein
MILEAISSMFGAEMFLDSGDLGRFLVRLVLNVAFAAIVAWGIHYRRYRDHEHMFSCLLLNLITFCMCMLLRKVPVELGFALGLFAVFGILRYRTEAIRMHDLTYLFILIGLAIVNSAANKKISVCELLAVNAVIVVATAVLEYAVSRKDEAAIRIRYDRLDLLHPGREEALHRDLSQRTGLAITRVEVVRFDMLRDSARITVHYKPNDRTCARAPEDVTGP